MRIFCNRMMASNIKDKIRIERENRLGKVNMEKILPSKTSDKLQKIRNIGIIAHIDAGKTTTTERMLYYAGALPSPGEIDEGTTTMDYMKQERERGITIRSAAISFNWNQYQINLIDTPGHVDFSGEVARSLRVLDGAITILDGGKGVEAQTVKVWEQASKRNVPKLCFINKMDRVGASVLRSAESLKKRLGVEPLIMQECIGEAESFRGVVDLVHLEEIYFKGNFGETVEKVKISQKHDQYANYLSKRKLLIEKIGNYDEQIGELYLEEKSVSSQKLIQGLRRILNNSQLQSKICPIFVGASFKNKGVQPLLDAVLNFLPSPTEREPVFNLNDNSQMRKPMKNQKFSAFVFKVIHDIEKGPLAYMRIYSGQLKKSSVIFNSSKGISEKIQNIYRVRANQYVSINEACAGDIVAISGFQLTRAGDTLTLFGDDKFILEKMNLPTPIFTVPFELQSKADEKTFIEAVEKATIEDNSLKYAFEQQTGQYLISGLGELHLQILKDKFNDEGIKVKMGSLKINYKETIPSHFQKKLHYTKLIKNDQTQQFQLEFIMTPLRNQLMIIDQTRVVFTFDKVAEFDENWKQFLKKKDQFKKKDPQKKKSEDNEIVGSTRISEKKSKKSARNPTPMEPYADKNFKQEAIDQVDLTEQQDKHQETSKSKHQEEDQDQDQIEQGEEDDSKYAGEDSWYHINTLPFETLYQLTEICRISMLSGKKNFPLMGVELKINFGVYRKSTFSKAAMNKCASQLVRQMLESKSLLVEPFMEFAFEGELSMIDLIIKDILKKRGRIDSQEQKSVTGMVPASSVKGWVKELRVMGLDVSFKFSHYEEIAGVDPNRIVAQNS